MCSVKRKRQPFSLSPIAFWLQRLSHFRCFNITILYIVDSIPFAILCYLALTCSYGWQEDFSLTASFPGIKPFATLSDPLLYSGP
jgi:hypothetical protein